MSTVKKRNWTFVLYPESAPEDWREELQKTGLLCAISPLHDRDVNPDGEVKKAHYHVILCYSGPTSYDVVKRLTDSLSQPIPQPLEQVRGMYRYFTHKDNPEKAQYSDDDISTINGFDIRDFVELTGSEIDNIKRSIQSLILELNITEYSVLMDYLLSYDNPDFYSGKKQFAGVYFVTKQTEFLKNIFEQCDNKPWLYKKNKVSDELQEISHNDCYHINSFIYCSENKPCILGE